MCSSASALHTRRQLQAGPRTTQTQPFLPSQRGPPPVPVSLVHQRPPLRQQPIANHTAAQSPAAASGPASTSSSHTRSFHSAFHPPPPRALPSAAAVPCAVAPADDAIHPPTPLAREVLEAPAWPRRLSTLRAAAGGGGGTREPRRPASTTRGTPVAVAGQTAARGGADGRPSRPALRARAQHRRRCHCLPRRNPIVQRRRRGRGFAVASWPRLGPLMGRDEAACAGAVTLKHTPPASLTSSPGRRQHHLPPQPHPLPLIVPPCGTSLRTALPAPPTCPR